MRRMDKPTTKKDLARVARMVELHASGLTLEQVGDLYGITKERVRQILVREGIKATDGGAVVRRAARAAARAELRASKAA